MTLRTKTAKDLRQCIRFCNHPCLRFITPGFMIIAKKEMYCYVDYYNNTGNNFPNAIFFFLSCYYLLFPNFNYTSFIFSTL